MMEKVKGSKKRIDNVFDLIYEGIKPRDIPILELTST